MEYLIRHCRQLQKIELKENDNSMIKRILFGIILLVSFSGWAQNYTALNGPYIGTPTKMVSAGGNLLGLVYGHGVMKSTNGGLTWTASSTGMTNLYLEDLHRDALTGKLYVLGYSQLFTSVDNGATWTLTANSGFSAGRYIRKTTSFVFIVGYNGLIYRSSNDGVTWTQVNSFSGDPRDFEVNAAGYLYIATSGNGIFRSTNNGLNVDQLDTGEGLTDTFIYSLVISGANIYATSSSGPFKSTNNGDSWASVKNNITDCCFGFESYIEADPSGNIYIFNGTTIWKTTNGGTSWTSFASPPLTNGNLKGPYFESSTTFYIGVERRIQYKTVDGGASWIPLTNSGIITTYGSDMIITDNGRLLYTVGWPNGFHISIDDGATWDFLSSGQTDRQIAGFYKSGSTIYAHGSGIIKTVDNGSNWTQQTNSYYFNNLTSNDGVNMYSVNTYFNGVTTEWRVIKSNDSGVNWVEQDITGLPGPTCSYIPEQDDLILSAGGNLFVRIYDYCSTNKHMLFKIDPVTGVATQIGNLPTSNNIEDIEFFNGKLYVFTNNSKLNISNDGGQTWTTKSTTTSFGRLKVISDNTLFILNSSVFLSTDGADNWVNTGSPGSTNKWNRFALVSSANYSYISQDQNVMFKSNSPIIPPVAPSSLSSFYSDQNSIGLIFTDNSNNENYFVIEMAEGASTQFDSVATTTRPTSWSRSQGVVAVSRTAQGLTFSSNTTYKFRVRAAGAGGKSAPSNEISVSTTQDCLSTSNVPLNRSWTATTLNQSGVGVMTKLNQTISGSGGFYNLEDLPIGASIGLSPTPPDPWSMGFEENCGIASIYTSNFGYIANGNGSWDSSTGKFTFPWITHPQFPLRTETTVYTLNASDPVPGDPINLAATVFLPGSVLLNWGSGNFTLQFEVERSTTSGSGFTKIADVTFPTVSYKDLDPTLVIGTTYYYRVRAKNATGNSGYTAEVSIIPRSNYLFTPIDNLTSKTFFRTGGGGSWGDVDNDGINDLFLPVTTDSLGNVIPPVIFKGDGTGQFTKLVIPELSNESITTRSVKIIDVNNDGRSDLWLTRTNSNDLLLTKNADGSYTKTLFTDYTQGGLPGGSWADYDNDGYLDLLANTSLGAGTASDKYLFHNEGDGTFTRITEGELVTDFGATRDAQWADYDNDGDQDVIVLNVGTSPSAQSNSRLYKNNGDGTFTRVLGSVFETILSPDRTASWGDYDNDGDLDIFIGSQTTSTNPQFINRLYKNNGDGTFSEFVGSVVAEGGLGTFGSAWADVDNDGDLDLFAMGFTSVLYYNNGDGTFTKYTTPELFNAPNLSKLYGPAIADVDGDGFLDFHNGGFSNPDIPNIVYRNTTPASASRKWLKLKLTGTASNTMGIGARVYVTTGTKTQLRELQSHSAHATQSSSILHFGVGSSAVINQVRIVWPSGIEQIINNVTPNQTLNIVEDGDAPMITVLSPADESNVVPGLNQLSIKFNEVPFAVGGLNIRVFQNGNPTAIATIDAASGTKTDSTYTYSIPAINAVGSYYVQIDPFAFDDQWGNSHGGISDVTTWNFNIIDVTPPAISFTEVTSFDKGGSSTTFTIGVTDAGGAVSAKMHYKKIGSSQQFLVTGNAPVVSGQTDFTVQESWFDEMGLEYYFTAVDNAGNEGRLPASGSFHCYLKLMGAQAPTLPNLSFGGAVSNYRIFSIPYELQNRSVSTLFSSVGAQDKAKWRLLSYRASPEAWIDFPSTIERGKGYFINIVDPVEIALGDATAPTNNQNSPFTISLTQGFNLIGNPYTFNVRWSDVIAANPTAVIEDPLYFNGSYVPLTQIDRFQGAFVFAESAVTITIPVVNAAGGRIGGGRSYSSRLGESDWELPINLVQGAYENRLGAIGMHADAKLSKDKYDRVAPPRMFEYLELNFAHPEYMGGKNFSKEMVGTSEEHVWEFNVASNLKGTAILGWDNQDLGESSKELYLMDVTKQQFVNMRETNSYAFQPNVSNQFKVYYGEDVKSKIKPTTILLGDAYPNPSSGEVTIPFTLPQKEPQYGVKVEVYDNMGRKVSTLLDKTLLPDFYTIKWNGNELRGGLYTYRLIVTDKSGVNIQAGKIVLKK